MKLTARYFGRATGRHRAARIPGPVIAQRLVNCRECGGLTAATVHGNLLRCTENHVVGGDE